MNAAIERLRALMDWDTSQFGDLTGDERFFGSSQCRTIRATTPQEAPEEHAEGYRHHAHIGRMPSPHDAVPGTPVGDRITATRHGKGQCRICQREYDKLTRTQTICGDHDCRVDANTINKRNLIERRRGQLLARGFDKGTCRFCHEEFQMTGLYHVACGKGTCQKALKAMHSANYKAKTRGKPKCEPGRHDWALNGKVNGGKTQQYRCRQCGKKTVNKEG